MTLHCHFCQPWAILQNKMNHCGTAVAGYVLARGNALAQGDCALVDQVGDERRPPRAVCALLTTAVVVYRRVKGGLSDGLRDVL